MSVAEHADVPELLDAMPASGLDYSEWVGVGMALKAEGFGLDVWERWSALDAARYHEGECAAKWATFAHAKGDGVGAGTIAEMARARGVELSRTLRHPAVAFGWEDLVQTADEPPVVDQAYLEPAELPEGGQGSPAEQLAAYLRALFEPDEHVGYVCEAAEAESGKRVPASRGKFSRTAGELAAELERYGDIEKALGDYDHKAGAWVRFNPLDGRGVGNANVTSFRYALVESDEMPPEKQLATIRALNLPCAAIVSSGGKSVHAIVRVEASDLGEYKERVRRLYEECDKAGMRVDGQNKNPSRLSRMPGAERAGEVQALIATDCGAASWDEWLGWLADERDDLPPDERGDWDEPVALKPMLVGQTEDDCILRQGAKMIVVGDSKMGKSYTLIDLAEAICTGGEWLGMSCAKGMVYYVNLEIDPGEFRDRQHRVWDARRESLAGEYESKEDVDRNFVRWNLRGHATVMDELAPKLVRRVLKYGPPGTFKAIIIDPIYKVNGGDDNDARAVAKFTNTLDLIIASCGCSVIYAHHHPKGATGGRKAIDRMSGSGVYGRDADTVVDFSPLFVPEELWARYGHVPLYRAEISCRSFGHRKPIDAVFKFPRFLRDHTGELAKLDVLGANPGKEGAEKGRQRIKTEKDLKAEAVRAAMARCEDDGVLPTRKNVFQRLELPADVDAPSYGTFSKWTNPNDGRGLGAFWVDQEHGNVIVDSEAEPPGDE